MNIIDHLSVGVPDVKAARDFYDAVMGTIGSQALAATEGFAAYGVDAVQFLIMLPNDGETTSAGNGTHICFRAASQTEVNAFHAMALAKGGTCAGEPGPRPEYPLPDVYTAFVRDPFGNKLEVIHGGFAA
jgi:catechol 2,3-dioxygenase-like lactoylglutathione lyase family enzyme